jgi:hypothetical protein
MQSSDLKLISKDTTNYKKIEDNNLNIKMIDNTQTFNTTMNKGRKISDKSPMLAPQSMGKISDKSLELTPQSANKTSTKASGHQALQKEGKISVAAKTLKNTDDNITPVKSNISGNIPPSVNPDKIDQMDQLAQLDQRFSQLKNIITELETVNESNKICEAKNLVQSLESALMKKLEDERNKINTKLADITHLTDNSDVVPCTINASRESSNLIAAFT